ncbi:MAG: DinB family protein [Anaerolineales bacterium]|nr:DinB family protein [Anaerolineales bacterium]
MNTLEPHRKALNTKITHLRELLTSGENFDEAIALFYRVHAQLHSAPVSNSGEWSFEDALLDDLTEAQFRRVPANEDPSGHSIAWALWHVTRIEDTTMNLLVAGTPEILYEGDWLSQMNAPLQHSGNEMSAEEIAAFSQQVDFAALRAYRASVGRRTREVVATLTPADLPKKVDPARLAQVMAKGALIEAASGIRDYWGGRTIAGLLLMPASRHILVHFNEILGLKKKRA